MNEELEWQDIQAACGVNGRYWALVKVLISKGIFTVQDLRAEMAAQLGRPVINDTDTKGLSLQ